MKKINYILFSIIAFTLLSSCGKDEPWDPTPKEAFLFYAASANNLESDIWKNVQTVLTFYVPSKEKDIYVYFKKTNGKSTLSRVINVGGKSQLYTVKEYDETVNCATTETIDRVMQDVLSLESVTKITDLLLSSHGSSWIPEIFVTGKLSSETYSPGNRNSIIGYGFGQDYLDEKGTININELPTVLEKYALTSILFDACNMCSIEVVYELRNSARYILASPAEILADGMNYEEMTPFFTSKTTLETLRIMAEETYKYYDKQTGEARSAIMTVTDCSKLEQLAILVKEITATYGTPENNILATPNNMIRYDYIVNGVAKDYLQYLNNLLDVAGAPHYKTPLKSAWDEAFPYCYHTATLFKGWPMEGASGVGGYIYRETNIKEIFNYYYKTLDWGRLLLE